MFSRLDRGALEAGNKRDALHNFLAEPRVMGDEQVHVGSGRAGQLDGIRRSNGQVTADTSVERRRLEVKG